MPQSASEERTVDCHCSVKGLLPKEADIRLLFVLSIFSPFAFSMSF